ncbi:DUF6221 family protein [Nocardia asteroides]|uniref:DUF6221 family protein n=1 Tax=Nocardia asteroides TaxID=1824 RepID=UPI00340DBA95
MTIEEFIAARLAEDEAAAKAAAEQDGEGESWRVRKVRENGMYVWGEHQAIPPNGKGERLGLIDDPQSRFIESHDPARVLRQVAALHAVVGRRAGEHREQDGICETCRDYDFHREYRPVPWPCATARAIAAIWSDHPDYRSEWAPAET